VFFVTTNGNGSFGHVYAFDPLGDRNTKTTRAYWVYPSYHPLTNAEKNTGNFPGQYHDPNFKDYNPGTFLPEVSWWASDQNVVNGTNKYYDGDIIQDTTKPGRFLVRPSTKLLDFK